MSTANDLWEPSAAAPAPAEETVSRPSEGRSAASGTISKSQRVRDFLRQQPEARNRDIAEALAEYGVTAADVANVKTALRRKEEKQQLKATAAWPEDPPIKTRPAAPAAKERRRPARQPRPESDSDELSMKELEAGVTFLREVGGMSRAQRIIDLIAQIREVNQ
jgi:hypothetical protein